MTRQRKHAPRRDISEGRKAIYYLGLGLMAVGFLMFGSSLFSGPDVHSSTFSEDSEKTFQTAVIGMGVILLGAIFTGVGRLGLAGSGMILDPQQARRDVEPWARMGGGVVKDVLDEAEIDLGSRRSEPETANQDFEERLRKLHRLHEDGILSKTEYEREKREILDQL